MIRRGQATASSRAAAISPGSRLGPGPGELEIGLDILFLQPQERRATRRTRARRSFQGNPGLLSGPWRRCSSWTTFDSRARPRAALWAAAAPPPGSGRAWARACKNAESMCLPWSKWAPGSPAMANFPGPCYCGPKSKPGQLFFKQKSQPWPGNRHGRSGPDSSPLAWFQGFNLRNPEGPNIDFGLEQKGWPHNLGSLTFLDLVII